MFRSTRFFTAAGGFDDGASGRAARIDPGLEALQKLSESTGGRVFTVSRTMGLREIFDRSAKTCDCNTSSATRRPGDTHRTAITSWS